MARADRCPNSLHHVGLAAPGGYRDVLVSVRINGYVMEAVGSPAFSAEDLLQLVLVVK